MNPFLEQCDIAANYLLSIYRDANKEARSGSGPSYFSKPYAFEVFEAPPADVERREKAEEQAKEVADLVNQSIQDIFKVFNDAVAAHFDIDELEGTVINRSAHLRTPSPKVEAGTQFSVVASTEEGTA